MATPPKGRKMAPERPFPILIETGKSYPKTGLLPTVFRRFCRWFDRGFPAVLPTVFQWFSNGFPMVFQRFTSSFPAVFQRFCRRFSNGSLATRFPWINPQPAPASSFIRKNRRQFRTQFHAYKPSIAHFRKCVRDKETCQTGRNG